MNNGYNFYFADSSGVLTFPITPGELTIKVGSNNSVVTLINEGDINILKSPSLTEVSFEARFPMRDYPYSRRPAKFQSYFNKFKELKEKKKSFRFIVVRTTPNGKRLWDTNLLVSLEDFNIQESADEGDDVLISFNLKQYKEYGVKILQPVTSDAEQDALLKKFKAIRKARSGDNNSSQNKTHDVIPGDCLWNIAKKYYGDGAKWKIIYNANKSVIETTAKKYGKASSSNGHWIYPGTKLIIPAQ